MLNINNLFIVISLIIGFIISFYYNKKLDTNFIILFLIISLIIYIIFYFLGNIKESYTDYYNYETYKSNLPKALYSKYQQEEEEERINPKSEEESKKIKPISTPEEEESKKIQPIPTPEEEEQKIIKTKPPVNKIIPQEEESKIIKIPEEEHNTYQKPNINKLLMAPPSNIPSGTPVNINISYNSQNSVNEIDNDKISTYKGNNRRYNPDRNIGAISENISRIYNNSDWIYGDNAWTNNPDYYIPQEVRVIPQKPLNEWATIVNNKEKRVCPLMDNVPWTEFKSGDSEPEPFNL